MIEICSSHPTCRYDLAAQSINNDWKNLVLMYSLCLIVFPSSCQCFSRSMEIMFLAWTKLQWVFFNNNLFQRSNHWTCSLCILGTFTATLFVTMSPTHSLTSSFVQSCFFATCCCFLHTNPFLCRLIPRSSILEESNVLCRNVSCNATCQTARG